MRAGKKVGGEDMCDLLEMATEKKGGGLQQVVCRRAEGESGGLNLGELSEKRICHWSLQLPLPCTKSVH